MKNRFVWKIKLFFKMIAFDRCLNAKCDDKYENLNNQKNHSKMKR
jgi:hypothetical protein